MQQPRDLRFDTPTLFHTVQMVCGGGWGRGRVTPRSEWLPPLRRLRIIRQPLRFETIPAHHSHARKKRWGCRIASAFATSSTALMRDHSVNPMLGGWEGSNRRRDHVKGSDPAGRRADNSVVAQYDAANR